MSVLFAFGVLSIALHRTKFLQPFVLSGFVLAFVLSYMGYGVELVGFMQDTRSRFFELILFIVLFAFALHEKEETNLTQMLFVGAASTLVLESRTLLSFILSFEALSLLSVVYVSFIHTKEDASGAVKLFMAGAISSAILFLGVVFYVMGGGELMQSLSQTPSEFMVVGILVMLMALFYKLTIVPFHGWAVDTYALVKPSSAGVLSGVIKSVVVLGVFTLFTPVLQTLSGVNEMVLIFLAIVTMTLGNFLALFRKNLSQILAYSSIAQAGYMLLAFVALQSSYAQDGILYIAVAYIFMQSAAFLVLDSLKVKFNITTLEELQGFYTKSKLLSFFFTLQLFSLAGIPLLAGFLAKAVVFYSVVDAGLWWLALIALLNSALSVGYYAWIVKTLYFDTRSEQLEQKLELKVVVSQAILALGTLYFGVFAFSIFGV